MLWLLVLYRLDVYVTVCSGFTAVSSEWWWHCASSSWPVFYNDNTVVICYYQGITLKVNDDGCCIVARIMHGGMIHKQGLSALISFVSFQSSQWDLVDCIDAEVHFQDVEHCSAVDWKCAILASNCLEVIFNRILALTKCVCVCCLLAGIQLLLNSPHFVTFLHFNTNLYNYDWFMKL